MKVGITGINGFIGWHLCQYLMLMDIEIIPFDRGYFDNYQKLKEFTERCDVIFHLAAINRHEDEEYLYQTNVDILNKLLENTGLNKPKIYFTSSIQEERDNAFGRSKLECWNLLNKWGKTNDVTVGSFVVPNVFGPFGKPNYNSFIATFCHLLANGQSPTVSHDSEIGLIHVHDLVKEFWNCILNNASGRIVINSHYKYKVSEVLDKLEGYREQYLVSGEFPDLNNKFDKQLFNMYRTYIPYDHYPVSLKKNIDNRGCFVEVVRANTTGQFSFSTTVSGITRGNHFHTRKAERFTVISGKAKIELRKVGSKDVIEYLLDGDSPSYVDMPIWYTHNITNVGNSDLLTLFWINEPYDPDNSDTYFLDVNVVTES